VIGTGRMKGMIEGIKGCDRYWKEERDDGRYRRMWQVLEGRKG
jgi:hypothetical protein